MINLLKEKSTAYKKRGFTLIELIVVIVVIAILVLLAVPRFIGQTDTAKLRHIQHDVRVTEGKVSEYLIEHGDLEGWGEPVSLSENNIYSIEGKVEDVSTISPVPYRPVSEKILNQVKSNLLGTFYANDEGVVYYHDENKEDTHKGDDSDLVSKPVEEMTLEEYLMGIYMPETYEIDTLMRMNNKEPYPTIGYGEIKEDGNGILNSKVRSNYLHLGKLNKMSETLIEDYKSQFQIEINSIKEDIEKNKDNEDKLNELKADLELAIENLEAVQNIGVEYYINLVKDMYYINAETNMGGSTFIFEEALRIDGENEDVLDNKQPALKNYIREHVSEYGSFISADVILPNVNNNLDAMITYLPASEIVSLEDWQTLGGIGEYQETIKLKFGEYYIFKLEAHLM